MKLLKNTWMLVLLVAVTGCYSAISSHKAPDFNKKIKNIFVIIKPTDEDKKFGPKFSEEFRVLLSERGVKSRFEVSDPLSLETDEDLAKKIESSNADAVMVMSQTQATTYYQSNTIYLTKPKPTAGTYDIKIFLPGRENPVWRGNMKFDAGSFSGTTGTVAKKAAQKVSKKLIADGVI